MDVQNLLSKSYFRWYRKTYVFQFTKTQNYPSLKQTQKESLNCSTFFNIQTSFHLILYGFKIITNKCEFHLEFQSPGLNLTHSNTEALFIFSYWFSDIFVHNFLEKWVFHNILFFLCLPSFIQCWIFFLSFWTENIPWPNPATLTWRGRVGGILNWKWRKGAILKVVYCLFSRKAILKSR